MDFVEGFPKISGKSVMIMVVDRFPKMVHFVPLGHPYTALSVAQAFFDNIVRLHGFPCSIVSNRDPIFTSTLWMELFSLASVKLHLSSAFRPHTNGQSEVANRVLGVYLRCLAGDRPCSWLRWLPWVEYCFNTSYQTALRATPFEVVYGRSPPSLVQYDPGLARVVAMDKQLHHRDVFLAEIRERLLQAQDYMKSSHDKLHRDLAFQVDDWVWLRLHQRTATGITYGAKSKLSPRFYGPFQVVEKIGSVAYRLRLPAKARIHDVFHVVFLKKHHGTPPMAMGSLPPIANGHALPVPAKVRRAMPSRNSWDLLVQWEGRSSAEATWEPLQEFKDLHPDFKLEDELFWSGWGGCCGHHFRQEIPAQEQDHGVHNKLATVMLFFQLLG